jgi:lysophospholipase L1-like esterase
MEFASGPLGLEFPAIPRPGVDRQMWKYDETKGWFHAPGSRGLVGGPVRINSMGLRGGDFSMRPAEGVTRILAFGDSFIFGVLLGENHLFVRHLETLLGSSSGQEYEVVNMGVSGYSTDQQLILYREFGRRLAPDLVIHVVCENDIGANARPFVYDRYYKPYFLLDDEGKLVLDGVPVPKLSVWQKGKLELAHRSNIWNALRTTTIELPLLGPIRRAFQVEYVHPPAMDPVLITARIIRTFADEVARDGAQFLVFNTADEWEKRPRMLRLYEELEKARLSPLDFRPTFQSARDASPDGLWDFGSNEHWNVDANRLAAEFVHDHLRTNGFLDNEASDGRP